MKATLILTREEIKGLIFGHVFGQYLPKGHIVESIEMRAYGEGCEVVIVELQKEHESEPNAGMGEL